MKIRYGRSRTGQSHLGRRLDWCIKTTAGVLLTTAGVLLRCVAGALVLSAAGVPGLRGQELLDQVNFRSAQLGGLRLEGISVFSGYSSSAYPITNGQPLLPGASSIGGDVTFGASATVGWQLHREYTDLSAIYTGTYTGMARYSNLDAMNHSLAISASRKLRPKWTLTLSASGQDLSMAQYVFQPQPLSVLSGLPVNLNDLAANSSIGQFSNSQSASMLTNYPVLSSPTTNALLGERFLTWGSQVSLTYAASSRLSFHFAGVGAAGEHYSGPGQPNFVMPRTLDVNAGVGLQYALSPRTDVGFDISEDREMNHYQGAYVSNATGSFGRKMGRRWFLRLNGGGSYTYVTQVLYHAPKIRQAIGGASLGFKTSSNTLLGSYNRTATTSFGFAAGTTSTIDGSWTWRRPGSGWSLTTSFDQNKITNTGFLSLTGWQASTALTKTFSDHLSWTAQYSYLTSHGTYTGTPTSLAVQSVRVSLGWSPQPVVRQ